jgi:NAD(P)-dependent dehydrogenase (short-subunit alcohol dehydrogenase family)
MSKTVRQYIREYQWSNVFAMIRNNRREPETCKDEFRGKLVVITGATSGIGYYTARKFASQGANLFCVNRNLEKSENLKSEIESEFGVKCDYILADLTSMNDIHRVAEELLKIARPIDVLIHNAGMYLTKRSLTEDGLDRVFVIHYLAGFIINLRLAEKLKAQEKARILLVNSEAHRFAVWGLDLEDLNWEKRRYSGLKSYGAAKTAQLLSMIVFQEQLQGTGVTVNAMHPGAVKTDTGKENGPFYKWIKRNFYDKMLQAPEVSAEALYYLGVSADVEGISGKFFNKTRLEEPTPPALDVEAAHELWEKSMELSGLKVPEKIS